MLSRPGPLTLVGYNLRDFGRDAGDRPRHTGQIELLRGIDPDVLAVQEFCGDQRRFADFADALGMLGGLARADRTGLHVGLLRRPDIGLRGWRSCDGQFWHNLGVATLDIGAATPLRMAVAHLNPFNPEYRLREARQLAPLADPARATIVAADWNTIGDDAGYDTEPDWSRLPSHLLFRHVAWDDDPGATPRADRRPTALLTRAGLSDAAHRLDAGWQATAGYEPADVERRIDAFRVSARVIPALAGYEVVDSPAVRGLSDHLPIVLRLRPDRLA